MASSEQTPSNPLLTTRAPEAALNVQLHPLVLLTISDYITRHTLRAQSGPIIGAIIGQQNGRNFTLEHAYECKLDDKNPNALDVEWFGERLEQYRDVHKVPALDLVGVFMLGQGVNEAHRSVVRQVQELVGSESVMLLLFHPDMLVEGLQGGKLPITLYESVKEVETGAAGAAEAELKFRELSFEVETGEAEMIGVDSVASGAGNASAVPKTDPATATAATATASASSTTAESSTTREKKASKGKGKSKDSTETNGATSNILSPEDEELIASLTAKSNAIKMLNTRLNLIRSYLASQPESYLTSASSATAPYAETTNHTLLRSINAMLSRLPLLTPPTATAASEINGSKENQDVHLTTLLSSLTRSVSEAQALGSKFHVYARDKANKERDRLGPRGPMGAGGKGGFGFDEGSILLND